MKRTPYRVALDWIVEHGGNLGEALADCATHDAQQLPGRQIDAARELVVEIAECVASGCVSQERILEKLNQVQMMLWALQGDIDWLAPSQQDTRVEWNSAAGHIQPWKPMTRKGAI
jgi:hypothetical protein